MGQKIQIIAGVAVFILFIAGAALAYNTLQKQVKPQIELAEGQANLPEQSSGTQSGAAQQEEDDTSTQEKIIAPDFTVVDKAGNSVKLSDMKGKPVVLNFWASWCPPCKAEMPGFDSVFAELGEDVVFMMVNLTDGQRETIESGAKYIEEQGFSFPVYYDTEQEAAYAYGIRSIPSTLFIDKDGYAITGAEGQLDEATLRYGISLIQKNEGDENMQKSKVAAYHKITPEEAQKIISGTDSFILVDVRTDEEYSEKRIDGSILIPDYEITDRAETELPDKDALILIYCRSGRRSAYAVNDLADMGYTNVYDFGGIIDWPYETVSD